jgi:hypothetical protein
MDFANYDTKTVYNKDELLGIKAIAHKKAFADYTPSKKEIEEQDIIESKPVLTNSINNTHFLSVVENKYESKLVHDEDAELSKSNLKKPNDKNDYITQFYIGSLSAIGLYILFRYLYVRK